MTTAEKTSVTPEELLMMPNSKDYELVNGHLVERQMGSESSAIASAIVFMLAAFIRPRRLGHLFDAEGGYQCFADDPKKVRKPDISFVQAGRIVDERVPQGYLSIAPDLAVEVISPGDIAYEIDEKVEEYLRAGVKVVWVVNPRTRTIRIHRPKSASAGTISEVREGDKISGEDALPGFECAVSEFFQI